MAGKSSERVNAVAGENLRSSFSTSSQLFDRREVAPTSPMPHWHARCFAVGSHALSFLPKAAPAIASNLLLVAASLKSWQWFTTHAETGSENGWRWFLVILVFWEATIGLWLLTGFAASISRRLAIATFSVFVIVAGVNGVTGKSSCGCFGPLSVNPWIMVLVDALVILALAFWRPQTNTPLSNQWRLALASTWLLIPAFFATWALSGSPRDAEAGVRQLGNVMIVDPVAMQDRELPLLGRIDIAPRLRHGKWTLIYHRDGCPKCREWLHDPQLPSRLAQRFGAADLATIAVPPHGEWASMAFEAEKGHLDGGLSWIFPTPLVMVLQDGRVTEVFEPSED